MKAVQAFLRPLEVSAINFGNKFKKDIFWRTQFIIIATLFFLCFANILIVFYFSEQLHLEIASVVVGYVTRMLSNGNVAPNVGSTDMLEQIYGIRNTYLIFVGCISVIVTLIFGYVVARIALAPAKNALASQKQFIGNIAHELRTPLAVVRANSEILLWDADKNSDTAHLIESNMGELDKISGIINNLLTLNAFHHVEEMEFSYIDLAEVIQASVQKYAKHIANKELTLQLHLNGTNFVWGNQSAIEQIITNILKNAIAYTPKHGSVSIFASIVGGMYAVLKITDTGIGIEPEKLNRIFEPFYQVDPSRSEALNSSGLGLTIVAELIKLHHGRIEVNSIPGKGTTIEIELPLEPRRKYKTIRKKTLKDNSLILNFTEMSK